MYYSILKKEIDEIKSLVLQELQNEKSHAIPIGHFYHRLKNSDQQKIYTAVWMLVSDKKIHCRKEDHWFELIKNAK